MSIFVILGLLVCTKAPGFSAVTHVFVQRGKDVLLSVTTADVLEQDAVVSWNFNKDSVLVRFLPNTEPTVSDGRIEFSVKNYSMKLKNLKETDSGVYTALVLGTKGQLTAEYNVTVQDPVSPAELKVDSVFNSSDFCNLTVTCSTQDSHLSSTFRCDTKTCTQEGGERSAVTTSGASVHIYLVNDSIICNHSNHVSWTKDMLNIQHFCSRDAGSGRASAGISMCLVKTVVFSVGLIIMVSAVICVHIMEKLKKEN